MLEIVNDGSRYGSIDRLNAYENNHDYMHRVLPFQRPEGVDVGNGCLKLPGWGMIDAWRTTRG